jgi:hypothetical protein
MFRALISRLSAELVSESTRAVYTNKKRKLAAPQEELGSLLLNIVPFSSRKQFLLEKNRHG